MSRAARWAHVQLIVLTAFFWGVPASAWIELNVLSDDATVEIRRDGSAIVAHQILLRLRGNSLDRWSIEGIDADAEPAPDATLTLARSGKEAGLPIPLELENQAGRLAVRVLYKDGVRRGGTFIVRFRYRTNLQAAGRIRSAGAVSEVRWQGPEFGNGVDSMRVVFRVPKAPRPPELPKSDAPRGNVGIAEEIEGIFLSTLRRGDEWDELDVVRPHVAKRERVLWRARVDGNAFDAAVLAETIPARQPSAGKPLRSVVHPPARPSSFPFAVAAAFGAAYALILGGKMRALRLAHGGGAGGLVPLPAVARCALASLSIGAAAFVALETTYPSAAGLLLFSAILLAAQRSVRFKPALRGPGRWVRLSPEKAFGRRPAKRPPGRAFDAGAPLGFALFLLLLLGFVATAVAVARTSTYEAVAVVLATSSLFPVFCTGRASEWPAEPAAEARRLLAPIHEALARNETLVLAPLGRISEGCEEPDELRLVVMPKKPLRGVQAIEVGHDHDRGRAGILATPYVIVRMSEGAKASDALPKGLLWTRGRTADERVAVLRPRLPTRAAATELVRRVASALSARASSAGAQPSSKAPRTPGRGATASKRGTSASPAHAT